MQWRSCGWDGLVSQMPTTDARNWGRNAWTGHSAPRWCWSVITVSRVCQPSGRLENAKAEEDFPQNSSNSSFPGSGVTGKDEVKRLGRLAHAVPAPFQLDLEEAH